MASKSAHSDREPLIGSFQSVVSGPAASTFLGTLLEMEVSAPPADLLSQEYVCVRKYMHTRVRAICVLAFQRILMLNKI